MVIVEPTGTVCFAQSSPVLQAPKSNKREARLFVTFRPSEKISDEISTSPGYEFNKKNSVTATSGKNKIKFDENITSINYSKKSFIYTFLQSLRQKIDDPLGKKRIKN